SPQPLRQHLRLGQQRWRRIRWRLPRRRQRRRQIAHPRRTIHGQFRLQEDNMLEDLPADAGAALAYCGVGIALMALGFVLVDILTPGNLRRQIWIERNRNAALLVSANLLGVGIIVATAIWTSQGAIGAALASSAVYGVIGLAAMALAFLLLDLVTPGEFR